MAHHQFVPRSRREALRAMGAGFGMTALASMTNTFALAAPADPANPWSVKQPHFPPKAKHVILRVPDRRTVVDRLVRSQAVAGQV